MEHPWALSQENTLAQESSHDIKTDTKDSKDGVAEHMGAGAHETSK